MTISAMFLSSRRLCQEVEDLGLDHDVQRRRRLVGDHQRRVARERHGDHDPLAHPARELVRVVVRPARRDANVLEELLHPAAGLALWRRSSWSSIASTTWSPTRFTGLNAFIAPWKTIEIPAQRSARRRPGLAPIDLRALEADRTLHRRVARQQAEARQRERALAAARLPR